MIQNIRFTDCAEPRSKPLLSQPRVILTNNANSAQHLFTERLTVVTSKEKGDKAGFRLWKYCRIRSFVQPHELLAHEL